MGIKHSILGLENPQQFVNAVKNQTGIADDLGDDDEDKGCPETTLKQRAENHEHKEDVASLQKVLRKFYVKKNANLTQY